MKRASVIVTVVLLSGALFAQIHGVPASVTSYGPGRGMAPGVPASVTSLGPNGYTNPCNQPGCSNAFFLYPIGSTPASVAQPHHNGHHYHHPGNGGGYVYVPYAYPVGVPVAVVPEEAETPVPQPEEPEPPAPTVFEHRARVEPAPYTSAEQPPQVQEQIQKTQPTQSNTSAVSEEQIPVVIVFKDGHHLEIPNGNYAIVGDTLYDLGGRIPHKFKLADLNLTKTIQLNEDRGVDFSVPSAFKPQS